MPRCSMHPGFEATACPRSSHAGCCALLAAGCCWLLLAAAAAASSCCWLLHSSQQQQQQHACRVMDAGSFMHACQLLLMRACARRAYCKKCRVNIGSKSSGWPNVPVLIYHHHPPRCSRGFQRPPWWPRSSAQGRFRPYIGPARFTFPFGRNPPIRFSPP